MLVEMQSFLMQARLRLSSQKKFVETEFEKIRVIRDRLFSSDFDRFNAGDNLLPLEINSDNE